MIISDPQNFAQISKSAPLFTRTNLMQKIGLLLNEKLKLKRLPLIIVTNLLQIFKNNIFFKFNSYAQSQGFRFFFKERSILFFQSKILNNTIDRENQITLKYGKAL